MLRIFSWIYQKVLTPVGHFFRAIWRWLFSKILVPVGGFMSRGWIWFLAGILVVGVIAFFAIQIRGAILDQQKTTPTHTTAPIVAPTVASTDAPVATQETTVAPTVAPTEAPTPEPTVVQDVRLTSGKYLDWTKNADKYRQTDGTYLIPVSDLVALDSGAFAILFEGEFFDSVGTHSVCYLTGEVVNGCKVVDNEIHINQGSFWAYQNDPKGDLPEDVLAIFGHDKWKNWNDQGIIGNPIEIYLISGIVKYAGGVEPKITPAQILIIDRNAAERCPASEPEKLENPYSDSSNNSDPVVIGAPGSFACRTLFIGQLTPDGDLVAYYWRGAKDGFSYVAQATSFYLVPESWGESEMGDFAVAKGSAFLGQYTTE